MCVCVCCAGGYVTVRKVSFDAGGAGDCSTDGVQRGGRAGPDGGAGCYLMICGQSLQALAFLLARASQAGSVDTC